jgi:hypothetical protein
VTNLRRAKKEDLSQVVSLKSAESILDHLEGTGQSNNH